jgi:hypothetical protein
MKKLFFIALSIILYNLSYAQIKVNSSGMVSIGGDPEPNYTFTVDGTTYLSSDARIESYYDDLIIDESGYYGKSIHPLTNYRCSLGNTNKYFKYVYCYKLWQASADKREKENIRDIENALNKVLQLKGIKYDLKKEYVYNDSIVYNEKDIAKI